MATPTRYPRARYLTRLDATKRFRVESLTLCALTCVFVAISHLNAWFEPLDRLIYDAVIKRTAAPVAKDVVIVAIDEASLQRHGPWPWTRQQQADLITGINAHEPKALIADIIYAQRTAESATLESSARQSKVLGLPVIIETLGADGQPVEVLPYPDLLDAADITGHVQVENDRDAVVRGVHLFEGIGNAHWPHLMLAAAEVTAGISRLRPDDVQCAPGLGPLYIAKCDYVRVPFAGPAHTYPHVPAHLILQRDDTFNALSKALSDKIVLLGMTAIGGGDTLTTPLDGNQRPMSGVEFNANLYGAILHDRLITTAPAWLAIVLAMTIAGSLSVLLPLLRPKQVMAVTAIAAALPAVLSATALIIFSMDLPLANALVTCLLIYPLWSWRRHEIAWRFIEGELDRIDLEERKWHQESPLATTREDVMRDLSTLLNAKLDLDDEMTAVVQRSEPLSEAERSLLDATLSQLRHYPDVRDAIPAERLAAQIGRLEARARSVREGRDVGLAGLGRMANGAMIIAASGRVHFLNTAARQILNWQHEQPLLEQLNTIQPPLGQSWRDIWHQVIITQRSVAFESAISGKDGSPIPIFVSAEPLRLDDDAAYASFWVLTFANLSEVREAQAQREEALAFLSHDLRSPLTSVLALIQQETDKNPSDKNHTIEPVLERIKGYTQRGLSTSDQFLQLSRLQLTGDFETYALELEQVLQNSIDQMYFLAQEKGITLRLDVGSEDEVDEAARLEGIWIEGNGELIERTFVNLLGNAVKYSDADTTITITVSQIADDVHIEVSDEGYGIPEEELAHIFDPYFRSQESKLARNRGAGLGLRFVKTVVERHHGRIHVISEWGKGTTFTITLPAMSEMAD